MYSFARRPDTRVVDEPLYGHYLRVSGADHPGRDEIVDAMDCDGDAVMRSLLADEDGSGVLFIKHMAHHLVEIDLGFLDETVNAFLIRDPKEMLPSLKVQLPHATLADTGLSVQWDLYDDLSAKGEAPAVIDSRELLLDPPGVLERLCESLDLDYSAAMLSWPAGSIAEDGVWARHWYHAVHKSTGFSEYVPKTGFPAELESLLAECRPYYDKLFEHAIRASNGG